MIATLKLKLYLKYYNSEYKEVRLIFLSPSEIRYLTVVAIGLGKVSCRLFKNPSTFLNGNCM